MAGLTSYGPTSFDLWASPTGSTLPTSTVGMTQVLTGVPLQPAPGTDTYLGQTYLLSGNATMPASITELADQTGTPTNLSATSVTGRFLFLGNLLGAAGAPGHVGLSEVRIYGRPYTAPGLVFLAGDGLKDPTVTFQGSVAALTTALSTVQYTPDKDYNSGNPNAVPSNVVPDVLSVVLSDLGSTDIVIGTPALTAAASVPITVNPTQDAPVLALTTPATTMAEDTTAPLGAITVSDVDAKLGALTLDPSWRGEVTLTAAHGTLKLPAASTPQYLAATAIGASADGTQTPAPVVYGGRTAAQAVNQALLSKNVGGQWVESSAASNGWALSQGTGGLLLDLGAIYNLDALQVWNFNGSGLTNLDPSQFDLYVSNVAPVATLPATGQMTQVNTAGSPLLLPVRAASADGYLGETYTFGGLPGTSISELGDQDGTATTLAGTVTGRYLLLAHLSGDLTSGHVGLGAVRAYGRAINAPNLTFSVGNGQGNATMTFQGSLADLNTALASVTYAPNKDYNSGNPAYPASFQPDTMVVQLNDLGHTGTPVGPMSAVPQTITITVQPKQDAPTITMPATPPVYLEETAGPLPKIAVADVDATTDPAWRGRVTLTVQHGTLSLPAVQAAAETPSASKATNADGTGAVLPETAARAATNAVNGTGLTTVGGKLVQTAAADGNMWDVAQQTGGLLLDLGSDQTLDVLQIWNFNGALLTNYGPTSFDLYVSSDLAGLPASTAQMTLVRAGIALPAAPGTNGYLGETYRFSQGTMLIPAELGDQTGGPTTLTSVAGGPVKGRYVLLANLTGTAAAAHVGLSAVKVYGRATTSPDVSYIVGNGQGTDKTLTLEGSLAALTALLNPALPATTSLVQYTPDKDYNNAANPTDLTIQETLSAIVDDLGYTDVAIIPGTAGRAGQTAIGSLAIIVNPTQDAPTITLTTPTATVKEDDSVTLPAITVADVDAKLGAMTLDPNWRGQVTLTAANGVLTLPDTVRSQPLAKGLSGATGSATVVYVLDYSGSTFSTFGGTAGWRRQQRRVAQYRVGRRNRRFHRAQQPTGESVRLQCHDRVRSVYGHGDRRRHEPGDARGPTHDAGADGREQQRATRC